MRCASVFVPTILGLVVAAWSPPMAAQQPIVTWRYQPPGSPWDIAMSPNGKYVAVKVHLGEQRQAEVHLLEGGSFIRRFTDVSEGFSGIGVSDSGQLLIYLLRGMWPIRKSMETLVLVYDKDGTLRWNATLKGEAVTGAAISPDGDFVAFVSENILRLYRVGGEQLWVRSVDEAPGSNLQQVSVAAGAFRTVIYNSLQNKAYVFDREGTYRQANCQYTGPRISPSGNYVGLSLPIPDDPQKDNAVARFNSNLGGGEWVGLPTGIRRDLFSEEIVDYSLSDRGDVVLITRPENMIPPGNGMKFYDSQLREVKVGESYFFYSLGDPRGARQRGASRVVLSSDGTVMAVSTGTEVIGLKNVSLPKKW